MARKKHAARKPGPGRPPKGSEATVYRVNVRLTEEDHAALVALQAQEQETANRLGLKLSPADAMRIALRREAERRGLVSAA